MVLNWEEWLIHSEGPRQAGELGREEPHEVQQEEVKVLHLGKNNHTVQYKYHTVLYKYQYTLGDDQLESSFAEKGLDVLEYNKLIISQQCALTEKNASRPPGLH